eukprot:gnl/TRDRNA2_/TRDRNA2_205040_c0_seq1.p1 gnl/TRDRNA2_/TRDRNA2_205040_c0~~gnl/TRDRNA2_/TRDRNA2_205040_c0_seq1.p1  ORF type:complete len:358 (-),score=31.04 gnl/TRDRNA2_/TRDRNA2_205040_c0_seq1:7-936(-)
MPPLDAELVFLMIRHEAPECVIERMLWFSAHAGKHHLLLEIIRRLKPSKYILGRVFMHALSSLSAYNLGDGDCLQVLLDSGAAMSPEDAVKCALWSRSGGYQSFLLGRPCVFHHNFHYLEDSMGVSIVWDWGRTMRLRWGPFEDPQDSLLELWVEEANKFPLQWPSKTRLYWGPDGERIEQVNSAGDSPSICWAFRDGPEDDLQCFAFSNADTHTPPQGDWLLATDAEIGGVNNVRRLVVSHVDNSDLIAAYSNLKYFLSQVVAEAEWFRREWTNQGWHFADATRPEQLKEVARWMFRSRLMSYELGYL